jgi:REP element-mobilizing transposase RayT
MAKQPSQLALELRPARRWGGRRSGAGRKRSGRRYIPHARREHFGRLTPCHVTLKVRRDVVSLRIPQVVRAVEAAFAAGCERGSFRLVHYSLQRDHAHLIVEAVDGAQLACGMKSLAARFARAVNRALRRSGAVLRERFHLDVLTSPRQVRNALAYVLLNARKHLAERLAKRGRGVPATALDEASSARWFDGWRRAVRTAAPEPRAASRVPVAPARAWLLTTGWRRHGLVDPLEVPGGARARGRASASR